MTTYNQFGGTPADVVQDAAGNVVGNQSLTVWTAETGGTQITDILTKTGTPTGGTVVSDNTNTVNKGRYEFQAPDTYAVVYLDAGNGTGRWPVFAHQIASLISSFAARMTTAEGKITDILASGDPVSSSPGLWHQVFELSVAAASLVVGVRSGSITLPRDVTAEQWKLIFDDYHTSVTSQIDLVVNKPVLPLLHTPPVYPDDYVGWVSAYAASAAPVMPVNFKEMWAATPPDSAWPQYTKVAFQPISLAPPGTTSSTAATKQGAKGEYNSGATASSAPAPVIPTGGATGDTVLVALITQGALVTTIPANWQQKADFVDSVNNDVRLAIYAAPWSAGLSNAFALASSGATIAWSRLIRGADPATVQVVTLANGFHIGGSTNTPTGLTPVASDLHFVIAATKYPNAVDGYTHSWTIGSSGLTQETNLVTSRGSTFQDIGLSAGYGGALALNDPIPNVPVAATGGTGSLGNLSWVSAVIFVPRAAGSHGPTRLKAEIWGETN